MKIVLIITFVIAVMIAAGIGSMIIFDVFTRDQGLQYIYKSLAVVALLGISSAVIAFATGKR